MKIKEYGLHDREFRPRMVPIIDPAIALDDFPGFARHGRKGCKCARVREKE
jgi:hypothetical protein